MDFDKLYNEYFQTVYGYLLSISHDHNLAEELTQETFFKALKKINSFKTGTNARAWLCQIAKNLFYDRSRRAKHDLDLNEDTMDQLVRDLFTGVEGFAAAVVGVAVVLGLPHPKSPRFSFAGSTLLSPLVVGIFESFLTGV